MLKKILNVNGVKRINKSEQKSINGGVNFPFFNDCCTCVFTPANRPYQVIITQSCSIPCPEDGSFGFQDSGC